MFRVPGFHQYVPNMNEFSPERMPKPRGTTLRVEHVGCEARGLVVKKMSSLNPCEGFQDMGICMKQVCFRKAQNSKKIMFFGASSWAIPAQKPRLGKTDLSLTILS